MSSIAARRVNTRVCQLQPNGTLSRGIQAYPGANGDFPPDLAPVDFRFKGLARPLAHEAQLVFRHRALHPQD